MILTDTQKQIIEGKICPYCKNESKLVSSLKIYSNNYGKIYLCENCNAYVGCHKNGNKSKGRLANKKLRKIKIETHYYFDKIWKSNIMNRNKAYKWLSEKLNIPAEYTHIGYFSEKTCLKTIEYSKELLNEK